VKSLGLISVIALIISLIYAQLKWGPDYSKTFSRLVAQRRSSVIYYFIVFSIFLTAFSIFMTTSFIPQFTLTGLFTWVYFLGVASQLICVIIPETGGYKTKIHLAAAGIMSSSVLLQMVLLATLAHLSLLSIITCTISLLIMISIWLIIMFKHDLMRYELGLQSIYFICYLGTLVFVNYTA
jgi:hypothetical protein